MRCPKCGEENPERFRLCGFCGAPLAPAVAPAEVRKTVTIVFCDLKGSTNLGERLDSESLREVLSHYFAEMKRILERHGGTVEKFIGDAVMAVFGLPRLHEDDALRAVRAAAEMQQELRNLNETLERQWGVRLANRIGVNTGQVVAGDASSGQRLVTGDAVNVAARLEQAAPETEILIGATTWRLVRDAVDVEPVEPLALKGKAEPVPAYRLIRVRAGEGFLRRLETPLVGRTTEMAVLRDAFERAVRERRCELATVLGSAGVGKTKLTEEFVARAGGDVVVLRGHCLSYGEGITFLPLAEAVRQAAGISEAHDPDEARAKLAAAARGESQPVAARLGAVMGLSDEAYPIQETFWAARKFFEELARSRSLIVLFQDIHWAEPTFLSLIEHVVDTAQDAPLLILCTARHELLEARPRWMEGKPNARRVILQPLSESDGAEIVRNLVGLAGLPDAVQTRIVRAAEGNPLFVEQMLSMLIDERLIRRDEAGSWVSAGEIDSLEVPPTISSLLAARLDRLAEEERTVLVTGSVEGVTFHRGAVEELSPTPIRDVAESNLVQLVGKVLLARAEPTFPGEDAFRFHHHLIRDSAYQSLLKRTRAELHERYVGWLDRVAKGVTIDYDEIVGYHLEQAFKYLAELARVDERGRQLGARAAQFLASAGRRALARGDMPAAANLLERALALLPERGATTLEVAADLADALREMGQFAAAEERLAEAIELASALGHRLLEMRLRLVHLTVRYATDPEGWTETALVEGERAVTVFEEARDHAALARAWRLLAQVHGTTLQYGSAEQAAQQAVEEARLAGDRRQETRSLTALGLCALHGPAKVEDAIRTCEALAQRATGDQRAESQLRLVLALLYAMHGRFDRARALYRRARATLVDLGARVQAATTSLYSGRVELLAGEPANAESELRPDYEVLQRIGERTFVSTTAALLGVALYLQGRFDEAADLSRASEAAAARGDVDSQFRWRSLRARVLAHAGWTREAEGLAREAVELLRPTDAPVKLADGLVSLAEVLRLADRESESSGTLLEAVALYERKGDVVSATRARSLLLRSGGVT